MLFELFSDVDILENSSKTIHIISCYSKELKALLGICQIFRLMVDISSFLKPNLIDKRIYALHKIQVILSDGTLTSLNYTLSSMPVLISPMLSSPVIFFKISSNALTTSKSFSCNRGTKFAILSFSLMYLFWKSSMD